MRAETAMLRAELERALSERFGRRRRIARLARRASAYTTSFPIEELELEMEDGTGLQIVFKNLGENPDGDGGDQPAWRIKPDFVRDPLREIETYRAILEPNGVGAPACYGATVDEATGRYWLFLEKVTGVELYQVGDPAVWRRAAGWLAALHTRFAGMGEDLAKSAHLIVHDGGFYRRWMRRAQAFAGRSNIGGSGDAARALRLLAERYDRVVGWTLELPSTFIHGEFYPSNILVQQGPGASRVQAVDWEMAAVGPALIDLAALSSGSWAEAERADLALAYYGALPREASWRPAPEVFWTALDCCRLHLAIQWLGWSPSWSPPVEHAHDWLGEALGIAERLEL